MTRKLSATQNISRVCGLKMIKVTPDMLWESRISALTGEARPVPKSEECCNLKSSVLDIPCIALKVRADIPVQGSTMNEPYCHVSVLAFKCLQVVVTKQSPAPSSFVRVLLLYITSCRHPMALAWQSR